MRLTPSSWGALLGAIVAVALLAYASYALLNADGSNYKALVAVWLWILPVVGVLSGAGYAVGKAAEAIEREEQHRG